ncbi:hypothetical protein J3F84DRAFT_285988 [Trichoderma pleuroticola]
MVRRGPPILYPTSHRLILIDPATATWIFQHQPLLYNLAVQYNGPLQKCPSATPPCPATGNHKLPSTPSITSPMKSQLRLVSLATNNCADLSVHVHILLGTLCTCSQAFDCSMLVRLFHIGIIHGTCYLIALVNQRRHQCHASKQPENGAFGTARVTDWTKPGSHIHRPVLLVQGPLLRAASVPSVILFHGTSTGHQYGEVTDII